MKSLHLISTVFLLNLGIYQFTEAQNTCGKNAGNSNRIVGGQEAIQGRHPWQVFLWHPGFSLCGGTLISNNWVVSAAHCLTKLNASSLIVILGAHNLSGNNNEEISVPVKRIIIHPNYNETTITNDIGLVELTKNVSFTNYIIPICLPTPSIVFPPGKSCWVTGWGATEYNSSKTLPNTLQEVKVRLLSAEQCKPYDTGRIKETMICTMDIKGGKSPCKGDSGGPLVCSENNIWYLVGVVSFGYRCGVEYDPSVYTYVPAYRDWIGNFVSTSVFSVSSGSASIGFTSGLSHKSLSLMPFIFSLCCVLLGDLWFVLRFG
ncbi:serine protease 33 [Xenopus laevis]|uniref:Serine protease 33 n=1 Tax=Xenopus laevis TaxID=8355 RepID=A0A8J1LV68_XENLA|nr:serine protease 33 [Xenopus laevis]OCT59116.1 hypothetical protein XELAEV_18001603mg [Xenopus laevis]